MKYDVCIKRDVFGVYMVVHSMTKAHLVCTLMCHLEGPPILQAETKEEL